MSRVHSVALLCAAMALAGCEPTQEEQRKVQDALPPGCTVHYLGSYGEIDNLVVVDCSNKRADAVNYQRTVWHGKTSQTYRTAVITVN